MGIGKVAKKVAEKAAGGMAREAADIGMAVADKVREGKDAKVEREIKLKIQKYNEVTGFINTGIDALNSICDAYTKIADTLDKKKRTEAWIQEQDKKMELERMKIDNDAQKIQNDFDKEMKRIENEHDDKIAETQRKAIVDRYKHEAIMTTIKGVFDLANSTLAFIRENQFDQKLISMSMQQITAAMNSLPKLDYNPEN